MTHKNNTSIDDIPIGAWMDADCIWHTRDSSKVSTVEVKKWYAEPHRYYHTFSHVEKLLEEIRNSSHKRDDVLALTDAAIYHDVVYIPGAADNEERSFFVYTQHGQFPINNVSKHIGKVARLIGATKEDPVFELNELEQYFRDLDRAILKSTDIKELMEWECGIFKEYQSFDYSDYKKNRLEFLKKNNVDQRLIDYVENHKLNVGVYVGSFNPFHKGHLNILEKAEKIFDKVIIVTAVNSDKADSAVEAPKELYRQTMKRDG
jgi:cytidyltransferase-like protein